MPEDQCPSTKSHNGGQDRHSRTVLPSMATGLAAVYCVCTFVYWLSITKLQSIGLPLMQLLQCLRLSPVISHTGGSSADPSRV
jgi:hypothetical protein